MYLSRCVTRVAALRAGGAQRLFAYRAFATQRYTNDHEWIRKGDDGLFTIGITEYAQSELGEVVFVDLPDTGLEVEQGASMVAVESVKAASDVNAPVALTVSEVNSALSDEPSLMNSDPLGAGWVVKASVANEEDFNALMDDAAYEEYVNSLD